MKQNTLITMVTMVTILLFMLSGCSEVERLLIDSIDQEEEYEKVGLPIEENANTLSIIDEKNPLNERDIIEKSLEEQKKLHKLGFITDEFPIIHMHIAYYPLEETHGYSSMYRIPNEHTYFKYEAGTSFGPSLYDNMVEHLIEPEKVQHDELEAIYGKYMDETDGDYYVVGKDDALSYMLQIGNEDEGFTKKNVAAMGKTLRTEANGVYDPFYQNFSFDINKVQFPKVNKQRAVIHDANVHIWEPGERTGISLTYMLSEQDTMTYVIQDTDMEISDDYEAVDEYTIQTNDNVKVTEFTSDEKKQQHLFYWQVNGYDYSLEVNLENEDALSINETREIIESSLEDERTFSNPDVFKATNKKPDRTKAEKKLAKKLKSLQQNK